jgi:hypothetical protein
MSVHIVLLTLTLLSQLYDEHHLCYEDSASDVIRCFAALNSVRAKYMSSEFNSDVE